MRLLLLLTAFLAAPAQDSDIDALIRQLGDNSIEVREKATAALAALGGKAEDRLTKSLGTAQGAQRSLIERLLQSIRRTRNLEAVLPPVKKVTLSGEDKPFKELAEEFNRQTGWPLDLESIPDRKVTLSIKDVAPFEALDALCRAGGTGYRFETVHSFKPGPGESDETKDPSEALADLERSGVSFSSDRSTLGPRLYVRHYTVAVEGIGLLRSNDFKAATKTGMVGLRMAWPPSARPERLKGFQVLSILDDKKRELREPVPVLDDLSSMDPGLWPGERSHIVHFKYPDADAKSVTIKGQACFRYPVDEELVTFDRPQDAVERKESRDGVEIILKSFKKEGDDFLATLEITGKRTKPLSGALGGFVHDGDKLGFNTKCVRLRTKAGEKVRQVDGHIFEPAARPEVRVVYLKYVGVTSEVLALEIVMDRVYQEDSLEFEFKNVDLP